MHGLAAHPAKVCGLHDQLLIRNWQGLHLRITVMQAVAVRCGALRFVELPATVPFDCLPVSACGRLSTVRVEGGSLPQGQTRQRVRAYC